MAEFDFSEAISQARAKYGSIAEALDMDRLKAQIAELEQQAAEPGLWDDPENAQKVTSRLSAAQSQLKRLNSASQRIDDVETLVELGQEEEDADTLAEAQEEVKKIQSDLDDMDRSRLCWTASMTSVPRSSPFVPAPVAWMPPISPRCCCACICGIANAMVSRPR